MVEDAETKDKIKARVAEFVVGEWWRANKPWIFCTKPGFANLFPREVENRASDVNAYVSAGIKIAYQRDPSR